MTHQPMHIAVLNDYEVVVAGVSALLSGFPDRMLVVEMSVNDASVEHRVDLALFDTYGRADFARKEIAELVANPRVGRVVVFTDTLPPDQIARLVELGVSGCLSKTLSADELVHELERIVGGEQRISSFRDVTDEQLTAPAPGLSWGVSYRESEVLALLTQGLRNKEIAAALYIGEETVKSHLTSIFQKMGVSSRTEAIAAAMSGSGFGRASQSPGAIR